MISLNLAHTSMTFSMNSVDNHEGWQVYGSTTGGAGTFSLLMSNTGLLDEGLHTLTSANGGADYFTTSPISTTAAPLVAKAATYCFTRCR